MSNRAYIAIGSNHNAEDNIRTGLALLREHATILHQSQFYISTGGYLNGAVCIETPLNPREIKALLFQIEDAVERVRYDEHGNKSKIVALDFDLVLFNCAVVDYRFNDKEYRLPAPDILESDYTAIPLAEIAPDYQHPELNQTLSTIAARFDAKQLSVVSFQLSANDTPQNI